MQKHTADKASFTKNSTKITKSRTTTRIFSIIILCIFLASTINIISIKPVSAAPQVYVSVNTQRQIATNQLSTGFMLDWESESWRESSQQRQLAKDANFKLVRLFSNRIEPCTRWYESSASGNFNWQKVDEIVRQIFAIGAQPIICLGHVRAKMDPPSGMSINYRTNLPNPSSYAAYAAEWVKHFKAVGLPVKYYEIGNEPWFYYGWNRYETTLIGNFANIFNSAAKAMRNIDRTILIGNNAFLQKKFLDYFVKNGENLDFIAFNKYGIDGYGQTDADAFSQAETQKFEETQNWYSIEQAKQKWYQNRGKTLPIIQTESNLNSAWESGTNTKTQQMTGAVYTATVLKESILRGVNYHIYYVFASNPRYESIGNGFGMVNSDNNQPWYPYYVNKMIGTNLAVGDKIVETSSSNSEISTLSWFHNNKLYTLLICQVDQWMTIILNGIQGQINVQLIDGNIDWRNPKVQSTVMYSSQALTMKGYTVALIESQSTQTQPTTPTQTQPTTPTQTQPTTPTQTQPTTPTYQFEDGFESNNLNKWETSTSYGESITIASYNAYSGTYHSRFQTNDDSSSDWAFVYQQVNEEEIYTRGYFQIVDGLPLTDNNDRFYLIALKADNQNIAGLCIRRYNGFERWSAFSRDGTDWVWPTYSTSPTIQEGRWYCIELYWLKDSYQGRVEVYIDGQKIFEITGLNTARYGNAETVEFGITYAEGLNNNLLVYGDQFAISQSLTTIEQPNQPTEEPYQPTQEPTQPETSLLFDDGFEGNTLNQWETVTTYGETVTVASYNAYSGTYHSRFQTNDDSSSDYAYVYQEVNEEEIYTRGYFQIVDGLSFSENGRFYPISLKANDQDIAGIGIRRYNGVERWAAYGRDGTDWVWPTYSTSPTIQEGRWYCIELYWLKDSYQGRVEVYIDGQKIFEITGLNTARYGNVDTVEFGITFGAELNNNLLVYGDQFAISQSYIGI